MVKDTKFYDTLGVCYRPYMRLESVLTTAGSARCLGRPTEAGLQEGCAEMAPR